MGWIGFGAISIYLLFAIFVYCTVHHENDLSLNMSDNLNSELGRQKTLTSMMIIENDRKLTGNGTDALRLMTGTNESNHPQS